MLTAFRTSDQISHLRHQFPERFWWPSIKPGSWNIPEHAGTFRNIPEHRIIIIIMRNICEIRFFLTELRRGGIGSVGIHSAFHNECRLFFFPANCVTWLYSVLQSHTQKMDDSSHADALRGSSRVPFPREEGTRLLGRLLAL